MDKQKKILSTQVYLSSASLLFFNLFAAAGVVFWGWSSSSLVFSYLLESIIIGFFTVLKIRKAEKVHLPVSAFDEQKALLNKYKEKNPQFSGIFGYFAEVEKARNAIRSRLKLATLPEKKTILYGFAFVYFFWNLALIGFFLMMFFLKINSSTGADFFDVPATYSRFFLESFLFGFGFLLSHALSYRINYLGNEEYKNAIAEKLPLVPLTRIIPVHCAIIVGAFIGFPALILIFVKIPLDMIGHLRERKKFFA